MLRKKSVLLLVSLFLVALLAACGGAEESSGGSESSSEGGSNTNESAAEKSDITIGFQVYGLQAEFATILTEAMEAKAEDLGVELVVMDGNYDVSTAISQLQSLETQNVDAIIVNPIDAEALNNTVNSIVENGTPVIGVNAFLTADKLSSYVGSPDVVAGEMETKQLVEALGGKGNVVIFEGPIGQSAQVERGQGIENILKEYPEITVLEKRTANWSRSEAMDIMENWLQSHGDNIDGVIGQNDEMALGALNALKAKGMDIPVVGVDGVYDALLALKSGDMVASIFQNAVAQGETAVEVAYKAAQGETLEELYEVPFELVTADNADEYIEKFYGDK
ncbi:substrate-binding domain-containing protein [Alkalihalobacillus sp. BA299]|uniref:substrate-binding domain-containing protein n=1 Tax=Alkalihalobacillus sp. BA299 TaxID=2815938 RepID=UPI001ADC9FA3|nr:substrate-binding domain-containing protein [Alkalihalobacillus sp. BA299]